MLLAFIPASLIFLLAVLFPFRRFIWFICVLLASLSIIFLVVDNQVYAMFKFHLNKTLLSMMWSAELQNVFDFSHAELVLIQLRLTGIIMAECMIAWLVWHQVIVMKRFEKMGKKMIIGWIGGLLFSYSTLMLSMTQNNNLFIQQAPNLPFFNQILSMSIPEKESSEILHRFSEQHYTQTFYSHDHLAYPSHPLLCKRPVEPYNIILIMVDALRFDSLQPQDMPNMWKFAQKNWRFSNHMSGGNSTQAGLFSLFYSLPSNYWTAALEQRTPSVWTDLLQKYGYTMRAIWSSEMLNPPMDKTIYLGFQALNVHGAPGTDVGNWDRYTTQQAIDFLSSAKTQQPFFLNLFYDAAHGFCRKQSFPTPHQPSKTHCSRMAMHNEVDPIPFYNRYRNAVTFIDEEVSHVLLTIEKLGYLQNSVVIFTSDHGQEFNDNQLNYWGHAGNFTAAQVQVPLIIHWPHASPQTFDYVTSSYDLVPTFLQKMFHCKNPISDYSVGQNLLTSEHRSSFILAGSYVNMGIIEADRLNVLQTSGDVLIMDKKANPIPSAKPRTDILHQALALMRRYYGICTK
jgi:membrane-anchored protein YejM (alkaline phosphatase superfamily)